MPAQQAGEHPAQQHADAAAARADEAVHAHGAGAFAGLGEQMKKISEQQAEIEELELRWFELTEEIG